jgi:hypothetical protein
MLAKIMQPEPVETGRRPSLVESPVDVPRFHRRADRRSEDQISVVPAVAGGQTFRRLSHTMSVEGGHGDLRHRRDATSARRLRIDELQLTRCALDGALDTQHLLVRLFEARGPNLAWLAAWWCTSTQRPPRAWLAARFSARRSYLTRSSSHHTGGAG